MELTQAAIIRCPDEIQGHKAPVVYGAGGAARGAGGSAPSGPSMNTLQGQLHGRVRSSEDLPSQRSSTLRRAGMADGRGRILTGSE